MLIPDRIWAQLTDAEQQLVKETVHGLRRKGREVICPHCDKPVRIVATLSATKPMDADDPAVDHEPAPPPVIRSTEQRLLESARTSGLLTAFTATVKAEKEYTGVPADIDAFFVLFLRLLAPIRVSAIVLAAWKIEFGGYIEAWQSNGIVAVISDGELVAFVPNRLTQPTPTAGAGQRPGISNTAGFELWTKSKFGYVPTAARGFGEALRQANKGKFGTLVQ